MKKIIETTIPAESKGAAQGAELPMPIVIDLPESLSKRIEAEYKMLQDQVQRLQHQTDNICRTLLEGFMAALPETEGRNFNLSADKTKLIEQRQ